MTFDGTQSLLTMVELEPIDPTRLRSVEGSEAWDIVKAKRNRIAIGYPQCWREDSVVETGLLHTDDLQTYPLESHSYYRIGLPVTLLPDLHCHFASADFTIDLRQNPRDGLLPLILRLRPFKQLSDKVLVEQHPHGLGSSSPQPTFTVVDEGPKNTRSREDIESIRIDTESFGARTQNAGWRFRFMGSKEIPLRSSLLEALVVTRKDGHVMANFGVVAEIDVESTSNQSVTWAFARNNKGIAQSSCEIPPNRT